MMIPKRYNKFGTVKILTVSRKQWYKNFENPSNFIFIVHLLVSLCPDNTGGATRARRVIQRMTRNSLILTVV